MKLPASVIAEIERQLSEYGIDERAIRVRCWTPDAIEGGWQVSTILPTVGRVLEDVFI